MHKKIYQAIIALFAILFSLYFPGIANVKNAQAASDFSVYMDGCNSGEDSCPPMSTSAVTQNGSSTLTMSGDIDGGSVGEGDNGCPVQTPHRGRGALLPYHPGQPYYNNGISYSIDDTSFNNAVDVNYTQTQTGMPAIYCPGDAHTDNLYHFDNIVINISSLSAGTHKLYLDTELGADSMEYYYTFTIASSSSFTLNTSNENAQYNSDTGTYVAGSGVSVTLSGRGGPYNFTDDGTQHQPITVTPGPYNITVSGLNNDGTKNVTILGTNYLTDPGTYDANGHSLHAEQAVYANSNDSYHFNSIGDGTIICPSGGSCNLNINFVTKPYLNIK